MNRSFDLEHPDHFTTGAIGPKGQRVFYLQARQDGAVVSLKLEKQQVRALADYLERILDDLPAAPGEPPPGDVEPAELIEPVAPEWVVGGLGIAYDEGADRVLLIAEELLDEPDDPEQAIEPDPPATARFHLTRPQIAAFVGQARAVVAAGRPPCPWCGRPLDPETGFCPCQN